MLKRKSEVLLPQQGKVLKIDYLEYMLPVVCSGEKGRSFLRTRCQTSRTFPVHLLKQFRPAIKMKRCLVLSNYLWKIENNEDLFL